MSIKRGWFDLIGLLILRQCINTEVCLTNVISLQTWTLQRMTFWSNSSREGIPIKASDTSFSKLQCSLFVRMGREGQGRIAWWDRVLLGEGKKEGRGKEKSSVRWTLMDIWYVTLATTTLAPILCVVCSLWPLTDLNISISINWELPPLVFDFLNETKKVLN